MTAPERPSRLLIVAETLKGGLGAVVREQNDWFRAAGWSVTVASPDDDASAPMPNHSPVQIPASARQLRSMALAIRHVHELIRSRRPDVIHCHGARSFAVARLASSKPPFVTLHGTGGMPSDPIGYGLLRRLGLRLIPMLATGAFNAGLEHQPGWTFLAHASPRLTTLEELPFPGAASDPTFLWLGRLTDPKRPDLFVRGIAAAAERRPVRGILAGDGASSGEIRALIEELDAPIEVVGHTNDVAELLRRSWALVLFSRFEGLAFAAEEAMWAGRAVISSPLPGIDWLLGEDAFLASDVDGAAQAIVTLADHDVAAAVGADAARRVRQLLAPGDPWPATESIYRDRLNGRR